MRLLWGAAFVGFGAAVAALYGRYRALPAALTGPTICRLEDNGCQVLFRTPSAALLGVPNAALGILFYITLMIGFWSGWGTGVLLAGATLAMAMSLTLAFSLVRKRLECRICWTGHAANGVLWFLLLVRTFL